MARPTAAKPGRNCQKRAYWYGPDRRTYDRVNTTVLLIRSRLLERSDNGETNRR